MKQYTQNYEYSKPRIFAPIKIPIRRIKYKSPAIAKTRLQQVIRKKIKPNATTKKHHTQTAATVHDNVTYASPTKQDAKRAGGEAVEESMVEEGAK
ncbi:hypothetical protein LTR22_027752 [Elasticomyces elasticus]|nr:hypothetical protein LTR22_027752 [Elasticomyces elasticus]